MNWMHENSKRLASPRKLLITGTLVLMVISTCFTLTSATLREITILDGEATATFRTAKNTVGEALNDANLTLGEYDMINVDLTTPVNEAGTVTIKRAVNISVKDGTNDIYTVKSAYENADDILKQHNISTGENDIVTFENNTLTIVRVEIKSETVTQQIPFQVVYENDQNLYEGTSQTAVEGSYGTESIVYNDIYKNGVLSEHMEVSRQTTVYPVNKVVKVGTKKKVQGAPENYSRVITCRATAYDGSYETLGKSNPRTALGAVPTVGTVAVDPKVIPLGTKLYIAAADGSYVYGYCFAGDTGGAIRGNRVDLFMGSRREALNFGSKQVNVYILN